MRLGVVSVALLVVASGCIGREAPDELDGAQAEDAGLVGAPEGRGPIVAFEETNRTESGAGGVDHHHDLWNGQGRIVIFETPAMMEPFPDDNSRAIAEFQPPQGTFIFEGTATVEFTISNPRRHVCEPLVTFGGHFYCTDYVGEGNPAAPPVADPNPPAGLTLRYKHASTNEWIDAGELAWGSPTPIKITQPIETDMPHATSSVWRFQVESPNGQDATLLFDAKAEIVRAVGEVIPLWPPHPLFYTPEETTRVVVPGVAAAACDNGFSQTGCIGSDEVEPVVPEKLVSYGTRTLHVWANVSELVMPNPATAPSAWFLYHRNATGQNNITDPYDFAKYGIDKRELLWVLPVDDGSMDSPYADGSRWEFELGASFTSPDNPAGVRRSCYGGCADWSVSYTLTVHAASVELPAEGYHLYCLDPMVYCGE